MGLRRWFLLIAVFSIIVAATGAEVALAGSGRSQAALARRLFGTGRFETSDIASWSLLEVGPGARSLVIRYTQGDSCDSPASLTLHETRTTIGLRLRQRVYIPGPGEGCQQYLAFSVLKVSLHLPVAGRRILWPRMSSVSSYLRRWVPDPPYSDEALPLVPRVVGLSPADAVRVLHQEGFRGIVQGHGSTVVGQTPGRGQLAPGSTVKHPYAGVVHLVAGS